MMKRRILGISMVIIVISLVTSIINASDSPSLVDTETSSTGSGDLKWVGKRLLIALREDD